VPRDPLAPPALDVDVLVVGAGISGVDVACRLQQRCPTTSWAVLEARRRVGGTWDLFRYPGIRSDSDMYTLGFPFRPWTGTASFATGTDIREYVEETARENGVTGRIHHGQRVLRMEWSTSHARWTVTAATADGEVRHRARFVYLATGYYDYESGHEIELPGRDEFAGEVVHPQHWPEGMPVRGRRVVVVGSGATAISLVPALVDRGASSVTMLQRSPGYVVSLPARDRVATGVHAALPAPVAHRVVRAKNIASGSLSYAALRRWPQAGRRLIRRGVVRALPSGYPVDTHFAPRYDPWDQRVCVAPDGDFFDAVSSGAADVVTGTIDRMTPRGIRLTSGEELDADLVVTATGLRMQIGGGAEVVVDGDRVDVSREHVYKGLMLSGVPNLALAMGYTNASWTLRADLSARWFTSLLRYVRRRGLTVVVPRYDEDPPGDRPLLELTSGYVRRADPVLPRQGNAAPWRVVQSYLRDVAQTRLARIDDGRLELS
jgi:monooxygenase